MLRVSQDRGVTWFLARVRVGRSYALPVATVELTWLGDALAWSSQRPLSPWVAPTVSLFRQFEVLARGIVTTGYPIFQIWVQYPMWAWLVPRPVVEVAADRVRFFDVRFQLEGR